MKHQKIKRSFLIKDVELRQEPGEELFTLMTGYAALFDVESHDLGGFIEIVKPGAFTKTLTEADVRGLWDHERKYVLGRSKSGTLRLSEDARGLRFEIDVPPTTWAQDLAVSMQRGDIDQMSFSFSPVQERWTQRAEEPDLRELLEVRLFDVSPVTFPAYEETEATVRELRARGYDVPYPTQRNAEPSPAAHSDADDSTSPKTADKTTAHPEPTTDQAESAPSETEPSPAAHSDEENQDKRSRKITAMRRQLELAELS